MHSQYGRSALMLASENGQTKVVKCLTEANLAMNLQSNVNCDSIVIKIFITNMITAKVFPYIFLYIFLYFIYIQNFYCKDKL